MRLIIKNAVISCLGTIVLIYVTNIGLTIWCENNISNQLKTKNNFFYSPSVALSGQLTWISFFKNQGKKLYLRANYADILPKHPATLEVFINRIHNFRYLFTTNNVHYATASLINARVSMNALTVGKFLNIKDLTIAAHTRAGRAIGWPGDYSLITKNKAVLTGSVIINQKNIKISVLAKIIQLGNRVKIVATDIYTGPDFHSKSTWGEAHKSEVLARFSAITPELHLPFNTHISRVFIQGSDLVLTGNQQNIKLNLSNFTQY